ncbi:MAG: hypothetical protein ACK5LK_11770 [Chthoniobacterales bacterium]
MPDSKQASLKKLIEILKKIPQAWRRLSPEMRWRFVLLAAVISLFIWALISPKPWNITLPAEGKVSLNDLVKVYAWWAAVLNIFILSTLALLVPFWSKPLKKKLSATSPVRSEGKIYWLLVGLAALTFFCLSVPRINHSFWVDEEFSIRDAVWGKYRVNNEGELVFKKYDWDRVFYFYETPNNHIPFSVLARLSLDVWQSIARPTGLQVKEWPMRVPSMLAGVATIFALAWALQILGLPSAGLFAAWLAAFNPWLLRLAAEGRGFALMMACVVLLIAFFQLAICDGKWRWWAGFAVAQFLVFYVFPAALYLLLVANACALFCLFFSQEAEGRRMGLGGRWFIVCALSGVLVIQLMLPLFPQMLLYLESNTAKGDLTLGWVQNFLGQVFAGVPWTRTKQLVSDYPELLPMATRQPLLYGILVVASVIFLVIGSLRLLFKSALSRSVWTMALVPGIVGFTIAKLQQQYLFDRYLLFMLPGFLLVVAVGLQGVCLFLQGVKFPRLLAIAPFFIFLVAYVFFVAPVIGEQISRPANPIRETVLLTRPNLDPYDPAQEKILTGSFSFPPLTYDPNVVYIRSFQEMIDLMERADREQKPLFINIGNPWSAETYENDRWKLFTDKRLFEQVARIKGWDATLDRIVSKYRPGSITLIKN